jgi:hypothetical protein
MTSFADSAKAHLTEYKRAVLGVTEDGLWARDGRPYSHILPLHLREMNLLEPFREAFWSHAAQAAIRLHRDFHHLNSSQAMAFNLFFPALAGGAQAHRQLVRALTGKEDDIRVWEFESVPDPIEGTNFDLLLDLSSGGRIFVELKFTENGFGEAKADERHQGKLRDLYRPRLSEKVAPAFLEESTFFANYQLLRNISHARSNADVVAFVIPSRNRLATDHANTVLKTAVLPGMTGIRLVTVESIVESLSTANVNDNDQFREHYLLFREKYIWDDTA